MQPVAVDYVIYHGGCPDGLGSALAAWVYSKGRDITYFGAEIGKPPPEDLAGRNVLICDFSYDEPTLRRLISECRQLLVIDHHKTSEAALRDIPATYKRFDMKRFGAGLTWEYFFPGRPQPKFIRYIEDNDIWTKALPDTNKFFAWMQIQEKTIEHFSRYLDEAVFDAAMATEASVAAKMEDFQIEQALTYVETALLDVEGRFYLVAYTNFPILKSTLGNRILKEFPLVDFTAVYTVYGDEVGFSLRSDDEYADVSELAQKMAAKVGRKAGGHRNATGMKVQLSADLFPVKKFNIPYAALKTVRRSDEDPEILHVTCKNNPKQLGAWLLQERRPGSGLQNAALLAKGMPIKFVNIAAEGAPATFVTRA